MTNQKLIVVIGATGTQGGSVVNTFLADPTWKIRALTRNASSPKAQSLAARSPNIEVVSAEAGDPASLLSAFQGAHAIFAMTDFWSIYGDESNRAKISSNGQTYPEWVGETEKQHGMNIFDAASQIPTLERLVFSSLANVKKWSGGKYTHVLHFDSKALAVEYAQATYPDLWAKTSILQLGFYLSNFLPGSLMTPKRAEDGTVVVKLPVPSATGQLYPFVAAEIDTGILTKALVERVPAGKNVIAYRALIQLDEFIRLWSKTLGVPVKFESGQIAVPEEVDEELRETFMFAEEFGFWGLEDKTVIHPRDIGVEMESGSVEEWMKAQDWSGILGQ